MKAPHIAYAALAALAMATTGTARAQDSGVPDNDTVKRAVHVCAACHGENGRSKDTDYPSLAGQPALYTIAQLKDFREQKRSELDSQAYMWGVSALLDDATIDGLANYYAAQTPAAGRVSRPGDAKRIALGRKIYTEGIPARNVRACAGCHGDNAEGASVFPRLAGQHAAYVYRQLRIFGTKLRPHGVLMKSETAQMTPAEMRAVAAYVQSK